MLLHPLMLRIEAEGAQHLRVSPPPRTSRIPPASLRLLVPLQADPSAQALDLHAEALRASVPVGGAADT